MTRAFKILTMAVGVLLSLTSAWGEERLTSYPALDVSPAPSKDGRFLAFVSDRSGNQDIWIKSLAAGPVSIPRQLTTHPAVDRAPALNGDGSRLLYVSHKTDPKGDVYVMDVLTGKETRLTDLGSRDSAPAWGPDETALYYLKQAAGRGDTDLYKRSHTTGEEKVIASQVASFSIGPHGWVVYSDGHKLVAMNETAPSTRQELTSGDFVDLWPSLRPEGWVVFSRYEEDTNRDGVVTTDDESSVWMGKWDISTGMSQALYRITPRGRFHVYPASEGAYGYFADLQKGNLFRIHLSEFLQEYADLAEATELAWVRLDRGNTDLALLMLTNVSRNKVSQLHLGERAEFDFSFAEVLRDAGQIRTANDVVSRYLEEGGELGARAQIYTLVLDVHQQAPDLSSVALKRLVAKGVQQVMAIGSAHKGSHVVQGLAFIESGRLHMLADDALTALTYLVRVDRLGEKELRAKALFTRGQVYRSLGDGASLLKVFVDVIHMFGEETAWGKRAIAQAVTVSEQEENFTRRIASLNDLARRYPDLPALSASAQFRIAELYEEEGEQRKAIETLDLLIESFPAQQALVEQSYTNKAEILASAENYRAAADIYRVLAELTGARPADLDRVTRLMVLQLVRSAIKQRSLGEVRIAAKQLRGIIDAHPESVEAHRGYIETKVMLGDTKDVQTLYRTWSQEQPDRVVLLYGRGLAESYSTPPDLQHVVTIVEDVVNREPGISYFHQTLGWAYEQREQVEGLTGYLEHAEQEYRIALELNDRFQFPKVEANLLLNLGNTYLALENYPEAYRHYTLRDEFRSDFPEIMTELLYRKHFAESSFKAGRSEESIKQYQVAVSLVPSDRPELHAELLERLGLVSQDLGHHARAVDYFSQALTLNLESGLSANLALLRRNIGVNLYYLGLKDQRQDRESLKKALKNYFSGLDALTKIGVKETAKGTGLFQLEFALDQGGSQAAGGFDELGETKLMFSFIASTYEHLDEPESAREYYLKKLELLGDAEHEAADVARQTEAAVVLNRIGVLSYRVGEEPSALDFLSRSMALTHSLGLDFGTLVNVYNITRVGSELLLEGTFVEWSILESVVSVLDAMRHDRLDQKRSFYVFSNVAFLLHHLPPPSATHFNGSEEPAKAYHTWSFLRGRAWAYYQQAQRILETGQVFAPHENRSFMMLVKLNMMELAQEAGKLDVAEALTQEVTQLADNSPAPEGWLVYFLRAEQTQDPVGKEEYLAKAVDLLMQFPPQIFPPKPERGWDPFIEGLAASYVDLLVAGGNVTQAFGVAERLQMWATGLTLYDQLGEDFLLSGLGEYRSELQDVLARMRIALADNQADALPELQDEFEELIFAVFEEYPWAVSYLFPFPLQEDMVSGVVGEEVPYLKVIEGRKGVHLFLHDGSSVHHFPMIQTRGGLEVQGDLASHLQPVSSLYLSIPFDRDDIENRLPLQGKNVTRVQSLYDVVNGNYRKSLFSTRVATVGEVELANIASVSGVPLTVQPVTAMKRASAKVLQGHHVLVVAQPPDRFSIPIREERGVRDLLHISDLGAGTKHTAFLLNLPQGKANGTEAMVSALLRAGYPHVVVNTGRYDATIAERVVSAYLAHLANHSPDAALSLALKAGLDQSGSASSTSSPPTYELHGFGGLDQEERAEYASMVYEEKVEEAVALYRDNQFPEALQSIEDALAIIGYTDMGQDFPQLTKLAVDAAFQAGQYKKAVFHQEQLLASIDGDPDDVERPEVLYRLGIIYSRLEQFGPAVQHLEEALSLWEQAEELDRLAEGAATLGVVRENMGAYPKALTEFDRSFKLYEEIGEIGDMATQYRRIGRIHYLRLGRYTQAREDFQKALTLFQHLDDRHAEVETLYEIGLTYEKMGLFDRADQQYQSGLRIGTELNDPFLLGTGALYLANTAWFQGEYQQAFQHLSTATRHAKEAGDTQLLIMVANTRGLMYWTLNDLDKGLLHLKKALALAEQEDLPTEVASSLNNLGLLYRAQKELPKSLELFERAKDIDQSLNSQWGLGYDYRNIGITLLKLKRYDEAEKQFLQAEQVSAEIKNVTNWVKALLELGNVNRELGKQDKAIEFYERAYRISKQYGIKEVLWRAASGKADILQKKGRKEEAFTWYADAVEVVEGMRAALKIDELRNSFQANKQDLYQEVISLLVDMGRTQEAFNYLERSRSRSFIDLLGNQKLTLKNAADQQQLDMISQLSGQVDALAREVSSFEEPPKNLVGQYQEAKTKYEEALLELKQSNPGLGSFVAVDPLTQKQVEKLLDAGVGLLSYKLAEQRSFVWLLTAKGTTFYEIPVGSGELTRLVRQYRQLVQHIEPVGEELTALYAHLIKPVVKDLTEVKYLGILPDGPLHFLSFAALKGPKGYMVDRYPIFYAPSASVLEYTFAKRSATKQTKVLAVGNPDLGNYHYDLPLAELEAKSIQWNFPDMDILTGAKANKEWFVQNISKYGVIHLAAHGEFDELNPLLSSLWLASEDPDNRQLTVKEIFSLDLRADLVTLSACQTGLGKLQAGELIGLNRAFIYAGTHALISALWRVDDLSTSVLMKHFYRNYVKMNKADSLRRAQLIVKKDFPHPSYWAGLSLVGDYQ